VAAHSTEAAVLGGVVGVPLIYAIYNNRCVLMRTCVFVCVCVGGGRVVG
jgi:hypothetical protein